jgi:sugar/nucleoside kinase (ribokinase family)
MNNPKTSSDEAPLAVGTGLLALDDVRIDGDGRPPRRWAGGTCGNVLLVLSYLGWRAAPVARLQPGAAADMVLEDIERWGVSAQFITLGADGSTPVIVHWIGRGPSGEPYHTFSWRCPTRGNRLPGYKPVLASAAQALASRLGSPQVFFFDRVSRGALLLAAEAATRGAAIVFEPSMVGHPGLFREAWEIADVIKFSHERLRDLPRECESIGGPRLVIETLGSEGLRYRSGLPGSPTRGWWRSAALAAEEVKDTAGAGDWCTAGIVHKLLSGGAAALAGVTSPQLRDAIRYGQALAAWTCGFEGARGGMYCVDRPTFVSQVGRILQGSAEGEELPEPSLLAPEVSETCLCPECQKVGAPRARQGAGASG